jgi:hypothetical protein
VFPQGAKEDPDNVLNLKVTRFDVDHTQAGSILAFPFLCVPELQARLYPETPDKPRLIAFSPKFLGSKR